MKARNLSDAQIAISPNAHLLEFPRSDAVDTRAWPTLTTRVVDAEGHVNFFEYVPDSHNSSKRWRTTIGNAVAKALNMPAGPQYVLKTFPDNYRLFDHHKGPQAEPRHDLYLYGPLKKRFRSTNEFIPHAIWLMSPNYQNEPCLCKYCSGAKAQREITASLTQKLGGSPSASPVASRVKPKKDKGKGRDPAEGNGLPARNAQPPRPRADPNHFGAVQKKRKDLRPGPDVLSTPAVHESQKDVRAVHAKTYMDIRRYFRQGEVVWCRIYPSIPSPSPEAEDICWWPGVIDEYLLKSIPVPRTPSKNGSSASASTPSPSQPMQVNNGDVEGRGVILPNTTAEAPWDVKQSFTYKVQFLGTKHSIYDVAGKDVIPYVSYIPSDELLGDMQNVPDDKLNFVKDTMHQFNPSPGGDAPRSFQEAVAPFAYSLQIASGISSFWSATDEFTMSFGKPAAASESNQQPTTARNGIPSSSLSQSASAPPQSGHPQNKPQEYSSISSAIQAASKHNDQVTRHTDAIQYKSVSTVDPHYSRPDTRRVANRVVGVQERASQVRFQGLWWGCERIWLGDFLRLKMPRRGLAPDGATHILRPGGPSKSREKDHAVLFGEGETPGAGMRGVFVRLDGLYAVKVPGDDGKTRYEARFCGPLFELVEEDWEGPNPWKHLEEKQQTNGPDSTVNTAPSISAPPKAPTALTVTPSKQMSMPPQKDILPEAPKGYKFRSIVEPGWEFVGSMAMIGGRYYPRILDHPRLSQEVYRLLSMPDSTGIEKGSNLWALEGLLGGYYNCVDPYKYVKSRMLMMQEAEKKAQIVLAEFLAQTAEKMKEDRQAPGPAEDAMVVDQPQPQVVI